MAALSTTTKRGIFQPDELALLQEVFDEACVSNHIAHDSAAAERMGQRLFLIFKAGTHEKKPILAMLTSRSAA
jgi:hypothetical protein